MRQVIRKWFWAWEFDKEEAWLNDMAAQGKALVSARYITKKTGNPWVAGMINGTVMCCSTLFATRFMTDFVLVF